MTRLTKTEKETTIILFNEGESVASIYVYNTILKKQLAAFSGKYPEVCRLENPEHLGGVSYLITSPTCPSACNRCTLKSVWLQPESTVSERALVAWKSKEWQIALRTPGQTRYFSYKDTSVYKYATTTQVYKSITKMKNFLL